MIQTKVVEGIKMFVLYTLVSPLKLYEINVGEYGRTRQATGVHII
jgi:hypothetical protein